MNKFSKKTIIVAAYSVIALAFAGCGSSGSGSSNAPASGKANLNVNISHSNALQANALGSNYKLTENTPEQITITASSGTVIGQKKLAGDANKSESFSEDNINPDTYTITANTYSLISGSNTITCTPSNSPQSITLAAKDIKTVHIQYSCKKSAATIDNIAISVSGLSNSGATKVTATFTPTSGGSAVTAPITITGDSGQATVSLTDAITYNVSTNSISGYSASYNPSSITATTGATEAITFAKIAPPADGTYTTKFDGAAMYVPKKIQITSKSGGSLKMDWTSTEDSANPGQCLPVQIQSSDWTKLPVSISKSNCKNKVCQCSGSVTLTPGKDIQVDFTNANAGSNRVSWPNITSLTSSTACSGDFCNVLPGKLLGGYYTDWSIYHYLQDFPSQRLYGSHLNTVFYQAAKISNPATPNPTVDFFDLGSDPYLTAGIAQWHYDHPGSHVLLSFGGWGDTGVGTHPSADIENVLKQSSATVTQLAQDMVNAAFVYGFNGVDIDYEWWGAPGTDGTLSLTVANNLVRLFSDIKQDELQIKTDFGVQMYISIASPGGPDKIDELENLHPGAWQSIAGDVDFFDPMTYDYYVAGDSTSKTNHQSRFSDDPEGSYDMQSTYAAYIKYSVPANKISVGIPAYGRSVFGTTGMGQTHSTTIPTAYTGLGGGVFSYKCIIDKVDNLGLSDSCSAVPKADETGMATLANGATHHQTSESIGSNAAYIKGLFAPWMSNSAAFGALTGVFISFDDQDSTKYKIDNSSAKDGAYMWELDEDISPLDAAAFKAHSITEAAYNALKAKG